MRNQNPRLVYMNRIKNITPQLRYDEKEPFEQWQTKSREKLIELLGLDLFEKCDLDFLQEEVKEFDEYTQIRFSFQSEPGYYVPAYIQIPKNLNDKIKPMICLQGHSTGMHISLGIEKFPGDDKRVSKKREAEYARDYGYCPVVMEQRYMGECGGLPTGADIAKKLYTYAGCGQNVEFVVGELGHYFVGDKAYKALNKMI